MPRRVRVEGLDGGGFDLVEVPHKSEADLQAMLRDNPQLIPSDDLGLDGDLVVVGRETTLASGAIDLLCLSRSGELVLVEFKTGPQNPEFRHALAQVIDYGSDLWRLGLDDFDRGVVQPYLASRHCVPEYKEAKDLAAVARIGWNLHDDEYDQLAERLTAVLTTGDFKYVVAAQRFTPAMRTSLDYLNATMRYGQFFLVEVVLLTGKELSAYVAQVVAEPAIQSQTTKRAIGQANEADFLAALADEAYRDALRDLLSRCETLGLVVAWHDKGASIRIENPDTNEPLSVGWILPAGSQWSGARFASFGVDRGSLKARPTIEEPIDRYVERIKGISAGKPASASLDARTFVPTAFPAVKDEVVAALEELVQAVAELG